ncbi:hypothetical protein M2451_003817 [Dysgonomonas sp. PFB1-18]|uniref:hypothetical protein n=1 Tax=unclassified Dysgonomonas TaxID=2630389 RepID=UPI0024732D3A|nr:MULTISPECIES: hypothetical protein [unclassified Dysgonomonas]MDH6310953.1 hypothetical protein [Dysgonomonas sp. PF1-14]MDH6340832.1 hypothetical protein [Dysgonomonas sp. PF1-16]MDH6382476.1 hypothetical protein [Dysgonomonas sp. PFB1-18]MDH6399825.1 hypothetical protein [Dysgonomonas sp. PF1-23]
MKLKIFSVVFLILSCYSSCIARNNSKIKDKYSCTEQLDKIDYLKDIQNKINNAFGICFMQQKTDPLDEIINELNNLYTKNKNEIILYWLAYSNYYECIYYMQTQNQEKSKISAKNGIKNIEKMSNYNSDDLALLAQIQSISLQFENQMKIPMLSNSINQNIEKSISYDKNNIRAYYVAGSYDYYTPEQFGGGTKTEEYLLKAIRIKEENLSNSYLPTWGKEEGYGLLIQYYIKKQKTEEAKILFHEAKSIFPNSYMINNLASLLVSK